MIIITGFINYRGVRLPDGRGLYTAPCGIRTKLPFGRRTPLYFLFQIERSFSVQIVDVTAQRVNVSNFTVSVFVVENIVIHIASVSIAITETSSKIKDKKPLDLHSIETKMRSRYDSYVCADRGSHIRVGHYNNQQ